MKHPNQGGSSSTPTHFYIDNAAYFITASTYRHQRLLDNDLKDALRDLLFRVYEEYGWRLEHWVILDDHYHLLANSARGRDLPRIIAKVHNLSAQLINRRFPPEGRQYQRVWANYWDYCPRDEREYNVRLCYLLYNPIRHGYVARLGDWRWSSFAKLLAAQNEEALRGMFREYREFHELELPADAF